MEAVPVVTLHFEDKYFSDKDLSLKIVEEWILNVVLREGKRAGSLNFIFCDDNFLHKINLDYLAHDTLTDVITFDYSEENIISGDIFISIERVRENALKWSPSFNHELFRVMVHGVLHLLGYKDKDRDDKAEMIKKEDFYLSLLNF